jgi:chromosome segregation ATPase
VASKEQALQDLHQDRDRLQAELTESAARCVGLVEAKDGLEGQVHDLLKQIDALRAAAHASELEYERRIAELEARLLDAERTHAANAQRAADAAQRIADMEAELQRSVGGLNSTVATLRGQGRDSEAEVDRLQRALSEASAGRTAAESKNATLEAQKKTDDAQLAALKERVVDLDKSVATITAENESAEREVLSLKKRLAELEASGTRVSQDLDGARKQYADVAAAKAAGEVLAQQLQAQVRQDAEEIAALRKQLSDSTVAKAAANKEVSGERFPSRV